MIRYTILSLAEAILIEPNLRSALDENNVYQNLKINIDTTDPLKGLQVQAERAKSDDKYSQAVYETPNGKRYKLSLTKREALTLKQLTQDGWIPTVSIKRNGETRKPISNLRCFGLWIARRETERLDENGEKITLVKLCGDIKINPTIDTWLRYPHFENAWLSLQECYRIEITRLDEEIQKLTERRRGLLKKMGAANDE